MFTWFICDQYSCIWDSWQYMTDEFHWIKRVSVEIASHWFIDNRKQYAKWDMNEDMAYWIICYIELKWFRLYCWKDLKQPLKWRTGLDFLRLLRKHVILIHVSYSQFYMLSFRSQIIENMPRSGLELCCWLLKHVNHRISVLLLYTVCIELNQIKTAFKNRFLRLAFDASRVQYSSEEVPVLRMYAYLQRWRARSLFILQWVPSLRTACKWVDEPLTVAESTWRERIK